MGITPAPLTAPDDEFMQQQLRRVGRAPSVPAGALPPTPPAALSEREQFAKQLGATVGDDREEFARKLGAISTPAPAVFSDKWFEQNIAASKQAAQDEMNKAFGPESQGANPPGLLNRIGHQAKSLYHEATGVVGGMELGLKDPKNATVAASGLLDPAIPAAYFGAQSFGGLTGVGQPPPPPGQSSSSIVNAVQNPSPENVQNVLLQGSQLAGSAAGGAASPRAGALYEASNLPKKFARKIAADAGVTGDLATRVEQKAAQAQAMHREAAADIQQLHKDAQVGVAQLQSELDAATQGTRTALKNLQDEAASIPGAKLNATEAIVRNTAQAVAQKAAEVQAPFEQMAAKATKPVGPAGDIYSLIRGSVGERGANPSEIPAAAFRALPPESEVGGTGARATYGPSGRAGITIGDLPPEEQAKFRAAHPELGGDSVSFRDLNRVKDDLYQAARASKDIQIRSGLDLARQRVIEMQEQYANDHGFGDQYAKAKRDYYQFKRELGSGLMDDFLAAQTIEDQTMAAKLAQMTRGTNAIALRTILKTAGVDTAPLDDIIARHGQLKGEATAAKSAGKATAKGISDRMSDVTGSVEKSIAERQKTAAKDVQALGEQNPVIKGTSDLDLVGKSPEEIARLRLQQQFDKARESGIWQVGHLAMTIYGVERMLEGNLIHGGIMATYGGARLLTPAIVRSPAFQDWVIRNSGISDPKMIQQLRGGLNRAMPLLIQQARQRQQAAGGLAMGAAQPPTPPQ